jgi:hypothetical protein
MPLILGILGLAFLAGAAWTIARADLGTTLGLTATGVALLVLEWRVTS